MVYNIKKIIMHKKVSLSVMFILISLSLVAQGLTVSGTVRDVMGESLIGVNIVVKGTSQGTISNIDGEFSIEVPSRDAVLVLKEQ